MDSFWRFSRDKRNEQVLGRLGGGLVVAATRLWAVFVYFYPSVESPEVKTSGANPAKIQADCGSIAIGGNVSGTTITAGSTTHSECASKPK